jgi:hypothetical protein
VALLAWAIVRRRSGYTVLEVNLSALEQLYADLRDLKESLESQPTNN